MTESKCMKIIYLLIVISWKSEKVETSSSEETATTVKPGDLVSCDPSGRCFCPEDPLTERYPDKEDPACERYYLCHLGNAFLKKCDVRQAFHPEKRVCLPRSRVPYHACPTAVQCATNGYKEDPELCTMYYMCFYRQAYHYSCEDAHYFDAKKERCVKNQTATDNCKKKKKRKKMTQTTLPSDPEENEIIDLD